MRTCLSGINQHRTSVRARSHELTPLFDAVRDRAQRQHEAPFHIPGHKRGSGVQDQFKDFFHSNALRGDLTELKGLDYLSAPRGAIASAQKLAASACGADASFLLVNGASTGIHAAVLATCSPGDTLLVARNCHLSAFSAAVLAGVLPRWLLPEYDTRFGVPHGVPVSVLQRELQAAAADGARIGAVLLVSPTYFGAVSHLDKLASVCHDAGVPLLVDEAHGAHLPYHPSFACGALAAGADVVIHSSHKTLSALTQSAMLHMRGPRVRHDRLACALQLLQTSSPSYLLMSSLDSARAHAQNPLTWTEPLAAAAAARQGIQQLWPSLELLGGLQGGSSPLPTPPSVREFDALRVTVRVRGLGGMTGYDVAARLEEQFGVIAELATTESMKGSSHGLMGQVE